MKLNNIKLNKKNPRRSVASRAGGALNSACERLEQRRLLCELHMEFPDETPQYRGGPEADTAGLRWSNRGSAGNDSDSFNSVYGTRAAAARAVVDAAFAAWRSVFPNFQQDGGNDQIDVTVTAQARGTGWGGGGGVNSLVGNKPRTSSITLGGGGDTSGNGIVEDGEGFFIDPTPLDHSEFQGTIVNAFTRSAVTTSPANNLNDLYSLVTIELQHALGFTSTGGNSIAWRTDPNDYLHDSGQSDTADTPGNLWYIDSPRVRALFTSNNGGAGGVDRGIAVHTARPSQTLTVGNITYTGQLDTGTTGYLTSTRYFPSYVGAASIGDMYGYLTNPPQDVGLCFYSVIDTGGILRVDGGGLFSNDRMEVRATTGNVFVTLDIGSDVPGTNMDGPFVVQYPRNAISDAVLNGGGGNDTLRVDGNFFMPVTLKGGLGNDFLDVGFVQRNLDFVTGRVTAEGGSGTDSMFVYDDLNTRDDTFLVNTQGISRSSFIDIRYDGTVDDVTFWTGSGVNTVNIPAFAAGQRLFLNSTGGNDIVNIGSANGGLGLSAINGEIQVQNDPAFTTLNINDTGNSTARIATIDQAAGNVFGFLAGLASGTIFWDNADIGSIAVTTGGGFDTVNVLRCSERLFLYNSGGEDDVSVGNNASGTSQITGLIDVGPNTNQQLFTAFLTINDTGGTAGRNYSLTPTGANAYVLSGLPVSFGFTNALFLFIKGGNGNDTCTLNGVSLYVDFDGGGGVDAITIDDTANPNVLTLADVSTIGIARSTGGIIPVAVTTRYSNVESPTFVARSTNTSIGISGTPASITGGQQMSIFTGGNNDTVNISPVDAAGNLTLNGTLFINSGAGMDTLNVSAAGTTRAVSYIVTHLAGPSILHVNGLGAGLLGETGFDTVSFIAGDGSDTFAVEKLTGGAAVLLNGGAGNDACTIGNGDMSANLTNAAAFTFDGGAGADRFTIANGLTTTAWNYTTQNGFVDAARPSTGYSWHSVTPNIESQYFFAGSADDAFRIEALAPGLYTECRGAVAIDGLILGLATNTVDAIQGQVAFFGESDGGNLFISDTADTTGDIVHLDANSLGAYAGDTLFGPGGSVLFSNVVNLSSFAGIRLNLGSGADVVYARPLMTARVTVNANNPAAAPGDTLNLALAATQSPSVTGTPATGQVTGANVMALNWTGFEGTIAQDAVAPQVNAADININGIPGFAESVGMRQAVEVRFSENVAGRLSPSWLQLQNLTTAAAIPAASIAVDYEAATNTARFTFPGFSNGALPDGNYSGKILAGLPDFFGNGLATDANFNFFFLNGDANHDRDVDLGDFTTLAARFGTAGAFSQGDFNYSGTVDLADFTILASKFGTVLNPPAPPRSAGRPSDAANPASAFSSRPIEALEELR